MTVAETNYTGAFTQTSTCDGIAGASPATGNGPSLKVTVAPIAAGSCSFAFRDAKGNKASLHVTVTTVSFAIGASSISPGVKSIRITLNAVNGVKPAGIVVSITANTSCAAGCTLPAAQAPPGTEQFTIATFDGTGATGAKLATVQTTFAVTSATNTTSTPQLKKIPAYASLATPEPASAGTPFATPAPLGISVQDADRNPIAGDYSTPIVVTDSDTSYVLNGSSLVVNGGTASRSASLNASTDTLALAYHGLAMSSVTLTAAGTGVAGSSQPFAPKLSAIGETKKELDLYNWVAGQPGYSGQTTITQPGWQDSAIHNAFAYQLGGTKNNCSSFVVTPASGKAANPYTVHVASNPAAGTCVMTLTGGGGTQSTLTLTYATSGIGITKHPHTTGGKP